MDGFLEWELRDEGDPGICGRLYDDERECELSDPGIGGADPGTGGADPLGLLKEGTGNEGAAEGGGGGGAAGALDNEDPETCRNWG